MPKENGIAPSPSPRQAWHRQVTPAWDQQHPSHALLPSVTTFTSLSLLPASVNAQSGLLLADTTVLSVIFTDVKYVLLCLQLWMLKWNLNCKKKYFQSYLHYQEWVMKIHIVRCQRFCCCCCYFFLESNNWSYLYKKFTLHCLFCSIIFGNTKPTS